MSGGLRIAAGRSAQLGDGGQAGEARNTVGALSVEAILGGMLLVATSL